MDIFLDTSWTLYHLSTSSASYRGLFSPNTTQDHLSRYFDRLSGFLTTQRSQYIDDLNDTNEKLGSLRECKFAIQTLPTSILPVQGNTGKQPQTIQIQLLYQNASFTFILYTPHLILSKAPAAQTKHVITFLSDTFSISIDPLKLPSSLLCRSLQHYVSSITLPFNTNNDAEIEPLAATIKSAIGTLKITISFSGPVAPHLKTLDLSVPYETVETLHSTGRGADFLQRLSEHIHLQTGLKLPLTPSAIDEIDGTNDVRPGDRAGSVNSGLLSDAPLRLSKITTAAFALSAEGRLRLAANAVENAVNRDTLVIQANMELLDGIVAEAKRRGVRGTA